MQTNWKRNALTRSFVSTCWNTYRDPTDLLRWLSGMLTDEGRFLSNAPFYYIDPAVQTHLMCNRRFSGDIGSLYQPAGFTAVAGRFFLEPDCSAKKRSRSHSTANLAGRSDLACGTHVELAFRRGRQESATQQTPSRTRLLLRTAMLSVLDGSRSARARGSAVCQVSLGGATYTIIWSCECAEHAVLSVTLLAAQDQQPTVFGVGILSKVRHPGLPGDASQYRRTGWWLQLSWLSMPDG